MKQPSMSDAEVAEAGLAVFLPSMESKHHPCSGPGSSCYTTARIIMRDAELTAYLGLSAEASAVIGADTDRGTDSSTAAADRPLLEPSISLVPAHRSDAHFLVPGAAASGEESHQQETALSGSERCSSPPPLAGPLLGARRSCQWTSTEMSKKQHCSNEKIYFPSPLCRSSPPAAR